LRSNRHRDPAKEPYIYCSHALESSLGECPASGDPARLLEERARFGKTSGVG
jgi:hypothetical protein